ncbi:MAG: hypothetical protein RMM17_02960 [Acidobacteriota bacterium]|nr:hypothetical protein [Blastocatellia bacterium]MDW8411628.1 hypothetical protein [Acidobacteriota bacterium]
MRIVLFCLVCLSTLATSADRVRSVGTDNMNLEGLLPADCLIYVRFKDLPKQITQWQTSKLAERYYRSSNRKLWLERRLGLKLAERLADLESSLSGSVTLDAIKAAIDGEAVLGVYDIGDTQFIFIARANSVAKLLSISNFDKKRSELGRTYYCGTPSIKFQVCWAHIDGLLIVASRERLLLDALANLDNEGKDSLMKRSDYAEAMVGNFHDITVWVDFAKVGSGKHFHRYWLYRNFEELSQIRTAVIDLEFRVLADQITDIVERRTYLLKSSEPVLTFEAAQLRKVAVRVPYVSHRINPVTPESYLGLFEWLLFRPEVKETKGRTGFYYYEDTSSEEDFYRLAYARKDEYYSLGETDDWHYAALGEDYRVNIDDPVSAGGGVALSEELRKKLAERRRAVEVMMREALEPAKPILAAQFGNSSLGTFISTDYGLIMLLREPKVFSEERFEAALRQMLQYRLLASKNAAPQWSGDSVSGRHLIFPLIDRGVSYVLDGDLLIVSNNKEYFEKLKVPVAAVYPRLHFDRLSSYRVVRLSDRQAAAKVFEVLDKAAVVATSSNDVTTDEESSLEESFGKEVVGLLDVVAEVAEVTFEESRQLGRWEEVVSYRFSFPKGKPRVGRPASSPRRVDSSKGN